MTNLGVSSPESISSGELRALNYWFGVGNPSFMQTNIAMASVRKIIPTRNTASS